MKRRHVYMLLFGIPGFFVAGIIALMIFGAVAGTAWLFLFGDDQWPSGANVLLSAIFGIIFLCAWTASLVWGFRVGKRLENEPTFNKKHAVVSIAIVTMCILAIVLQQWSAGNIGPKSDGLACSEICSDKGYDASSMPSRESGDRTCGCMDFSGETVFETEIPLHEE